MICGQVGRHRADDGTGGVGDGGVVVCVFEGGAGLGVVGHGGVVGVRVGVEVVVVVGRGVCDGADEAGFVGVVGGVVGGEDVGGCADDGADCCGGHCGVGMWWWWWWRCLVMDFWL